MSHQIVRPIRGPVRGKGWHRPKARDDDPRLLTRLSPCTFQSSEGVLRVMRWKTIASTEGCHACSGEDRRWMPGPVHLLVAKPRLAHVLCPYIVLRIEYCGALAKAQATNSRGASKTPG